MDATTFITKILTTTTSHVITPGCSFDPKAAMGALLEFTALDIIEEYVLVTHYIFLLELSTCEALMEWNSTDQTVMLLTKWTF